MPTTEQTPRVTLAHALPLPTAGAVAAALQEALDDLIAAELLALDATLGLAQKRRALQESEDYVLLSDPPILDGKNESIRAAQLRYHTTLAQDELEQAEDDRLRAASALEGARATFAAQKLLARLLAGERDDV